MNIFNINIKVKSNHCGLERKAAFSLEAGNSSNSFPVVRNWLLGGWELGCWGGQDGWRYCSSNWRNKLVQLGAVSCSEKVSKEHSFCSCCVQIGFLCNSNASGTVSSGNRPRDAK